MDSNLNSKPVSDLALSSSQIQQHKGWSFPAGTWQTAHSPDGNLLLCCTQESLPKYLASGPLQRLSCFPQICLSWIPPDTSQRWDEMGLLWSFDRGPWYVLITEALTSTAPPRNSRGDERRKNSWPECRGMCVSQRQSRASLGQLGDGRRQRKARTAHAGTGEMDFTLVALSEFQVFALWLLPVP